MQTKYARRCVAQNEHGLLNLLALTDPEWLHRNEDTLQPVRVAPDPVADNAAAAGIA